jgi:hypothetical protein
MLWTLPSRQPHMEEKLTCIHAELLIPCEQTLEAHGVDPTTTVYLYLCKDSIAVSHLQSIRLASTLHFPHSDILLDIWLIVN